jgi:hypothetical protein
MPLQPGGCVFERPVRRRDGVSLLASAIYTPEAVIELGTTTMNLETTASALRNTAVYSVLKARRPTVARYASEWWAPGQPAGRSPCNSGRRSPACDWRDCESDGRPCGTGIP